MFFAISGFVVSRSVGLRPVQPLGAWLAGFYARRIVRILPAVWVCLLLSTLATVLVVPYAYLSGTIQRTGLAAFFGFSNVVLAANANDYFSPLAEFNSFTQTWSLGVEEQYYLVFPFIFVFYVLGKPRIAGWSLVAIAALSLGLAAQAMATAPARAFFLITDRFWELAAGVGAVWPAWGHDHRGGAGGGAAGMGGCRRDLGAAAGDLAVDRQSPSGRLVWDRYRHRPRGLPAGDQAHADHRWQCRAHHADRVRAANGGRGACVRGR
jgi:peptidoglycan/LPS O-acetylase OafA/YrhL